MLQTVKQLFQRKAPSQPSYKNSSSNFVTEGPAITALLTDLQSSLLPCSVFINQSTEVFFSEILRVDSTTNTLTLDELRQIEGNELLKNCQTIKVVFVFRGIDVSFTLNRPLNTPENAKQHVFTMPTKVYYPQKKIAVAAIDVQNLKLHFEGFSNSTKLLVLGHVCDLSEAGISANLAHNKILLEKGDLLKKCHVILPESKKVVTFDLILDIVNLPVASNAKTFISGHFQNMSSKDQVNYDHFMRKVEQDEIKKHRSK